MEPPKKQTPLLVAILPILTVVLLFINPFLGIVSALAIAIFFQKEGGHWEKIFLIILKPFSGYVKLWPGPKMRPMLAI